MTIYAILAFGWPIAGIAERLRNNAEISRLTRFRQVVEQLPQSNLQVLSVAWPQVSAAMAISQRYELLCGDVHPSLRSWNSMDWPILPAATLTLIGYRG